MHAAAARVFQPVDLEQKIRIYFYNELVSRVLAQGDYTAANLDQKILQAIVGIIRSTLLASAAKPATILPDDQGDAVARITNENCPGKYKAFHWAITGLKQKRNETDEELYALAMQVTQLDSFQDINPKNLLLSMANIAPAVQPIKYDESNVTADLIRKSFYNEMLMQALLACEKGWMSREDLLDEDPDIYINLPALTLMEAIQTSQRCSNGIRLLGDKAVNLGNCPQQENFPLLVKTILDAKQKITALTEEQTLAVKHLLATDADLPDHLAELQTSELMNIVGFVNGMSIEISRREVFLEMINKVRTTALEMIPQQEQPTMMRPSN